jgi:hypothetical protein
MLRALPALLVVACSYVPEGTRAPTPQEACAAAAGGLPLGTVIQVAYLPQDRLQEVCLASVRVAACQLYDQDGHPLFALLEGVDLGAIAHEAMHVVCGVTPGCYDHTAPMWEGEGEARAAALRCQK